MTQQQTERDDALIAEARKNIEKICPALKDDTRTIAAEALRLERSGWTPPAKPDRYVVAAREFLAAWGERVLAVDQGEYDGDKRFQAAAAVLRRHFEPPVRVIQAARCLKDGSPKGGSAELCADFILKGDV